MDEQVVRQVIDSHTVEKQKNKTIISEETECFSVWHVVLVVIAYMQQTHSQKVGSVIGNIDRKYRTILRYRYYDKTSGDHIGSVIRTINIRRHSDKTQT